MPDMSNEGTQPLLSTRTRGHELYASGWGNRRVEDTFDWSRRGLQRFLSSKTHHYAILLLVALDVSSILADIIIILFQCDYPHRAPGLGKARNILGIVGLVFSCLFMLELIVSIWTFRWA
jgi:hypothetical protein